MTFKQKLLFALVLSGKISAICIGLILWVRSILVIMETIEPIVGKFVTVITIICYLAISVVFAGVFLTSNEFWDKYNSRN